MAAEFYLPQEIINHIQSFLSAKEHAQSSVLSKSWYSSWPKRPVLKLVENNSFSPPDNVACLRPFFTDATETLNRYTNLNLKVDKFVLQMGLGLNRYSKLMGMNEYEFSRDNTLASHLITSALELGVSEIGLSVRYHSNFNLRYDLPAQVFSCNSLIRLSVKDYMIDVVIGNRVLCSRLKSLVLYEVQTTDDVVRNILFGCPLIENLDLCRCVGLDKLNVSKSMNLVEFRIVTRSAVRVEFLDLEETNMTKFHCLRRLELTGVRISNAEFLFGCPLIEKLDLCHCVGLDKLNVSKLFNLVKFRIDTGIAVRVEFMDLEKTNMTKFRCLRRLNLIKVRISSAEFFTRFGCMFPCIEDLTLGCCGDYEEINISSHSIKRLSLYRCEGLMKAQLNVPNITKFEFKSGRMDGISGHHPLPSLCFHNVSKDWKSDVEIRWSCDITEACWFLDLRKFLIQLTFSKTSLFISFSGNSVVNPLENIPCFPTISIVEDLDVCACGSRDLNARDNLLLGLSRSCRPKWIHDFCCG